MQTNRNIVTISTLLLSLTFANNVMSCPYESYPREDPEYEGPMWAMGHFVRTYGVCDGDTLDGVTTVMQPDWEHAFRNIFDYDEVWTRSNTEVGGRFLIDGDYFDGDQCFTFDHLAMGGIDQADVTFLVVHGGFTFNDFGDKGNFLLMGMDDVIPGRDGGCCGPRITWDIGLGDTRCKALLAFACESAQLEFWEGGQLAGMQKGEQFNTYNAFHGDSWHSPHERAVFNRYLEDAVWEGIGEEWVVEGTNVYRIPEACAVSIIWGDSLFQMERQFVHGGYADLKSTGAGFWSYWYIDGCDPANGPPL